MENFEHKSLITKPYNLTYSYYLSPDFHKKLNPNVPTLLLLHGFPDDAHMWEGAMPILTKLPYPMVVPDLLGFSGSSKPAEPSHYNYKRQANSLAQILDREGVPNNVIPIGHDWGSATAQRFYLYHKTRCVGLSLLSLAYQVPSGQAFDLAGTNKTTTERFGYPQWEYWNFFCAPDAPELMRLHLERFWAVNNGNFPSPHAADTPRGRDIWMREMFCVPNGMREYVTGTGKYAGYEVPLKKYPNGEKNLRDFAIRMSRDGFEGPVNYYHSLANNTMLDDEKELASGAGTDQDKRKIEVPLLYIGQTGDWVCRTDLMADAQKEGLVPDLEEKVVDAGHWVLYEKPEEIANILAEWLQKRFPVKS